jgi:hypothetical protein
MEREHRDKSWRELNESGAFGEHRAYVIGAIFAAVAFREATINELFAGTADERAVGPVEHLPSDARALMRNLWRCESFSQSAFTKNKFQVALDLSGKEQFIARHPSYQDFDLLIKLRDRLIHFKPEWIAAGQLATQSDLHEVEKRLRRKFPLNPLLPEPTAEHPFYPDKCLSHGCAEWVVKSSLAFTNEFHTRMSIPSRYDRCGPFVTD